MIDLFRVYDANPPQAGHAFLVERLWPRALRRGLIPVDDWLKDLAPSTELRQWFKHDPEKWAEFQRRYFLELDVQPDAWAPLVSPDRAILLYSSRDRQHTTGAPFSAQNGPPARAKDD